MDQTEVLNEALVSILAEESEPDDELLAAIRTLSSGLADTGMVPGEFLAKVLAELPNELLAPPDTYKRRTDMEYEVRVDFTAADLSYVEEEELREGFSLSPQLLYQTVAATNTALLAMERFGAVLRVPIFDLLGLRNLSGLLGEVVAAELERLDSDRLLLNPHQDGYPDLLPKTDPFKDYVAQIEAEGRSTDKAAWSDPGFGGVEVKATCGNTVPASRAPKPGLGDERATLITSFDWKSHHQETKFLLAVAWDFVDGVPTVTAAFYRNDLEGADWGGIVAPKKGGGRTTSVSVMRRSGIQKLAEGWVVRSLDDLSRTGLANGRVLA